MQTINVLVFSNLPGGLHPYEEAAFEVVFHPTNPMRPTIRFEGPFWAFLDRESPELSGIEICRRLRCDPLTAHAFIVMAADDLQPSARRSAIQAGVSEYLPGPITRDAILQRVLADRTPLGDQRLLKLGGLTIDLSTREARWRAKLLDLMPTQRRLLQFFVENPGKIFTRRQLIEALDNLDSQIAERTIDVAIGRLRQALRDAGAGEMLRTVRSLGYMLVTPSERASA